MISLLSCQSGKTHAQMFEEIRNRRNRPIHDCRDKALNISLTGMDLSILCMKTSLAVLKHTPTSTIAIVLETRQEIDRHYALIDLQLAVAGALFKNIFSRNL